MKCLDLLLEMLDFTEEEPLPAASELWALPNEKVLISPHATDMTGGVSAQATSNRCSGTRVM